MPRSSPRVTLGFQTAGHHGPGARGLPQAQPRQRHGGEYKRLTLTGDLIDEAGLPAQEDYILRAHETLDEMAKVDERMARVVEMRYFVGMPDVEIGAALGLTDFRAAPSPASCLR